MIIKHGILNQNVYADVVDGFVASEDWTSYKPYAEDIWAGNRVRICYEESSTVCHIYFKDLNKTTLTVKRNAKACIDYNLINCNKIWNQLNV